MKTLTALANRLDLGFEKDKSRRSSRILVRETGKIDILLRWKENRRERFGGKWSSSWVMLSLTGLLDIQVGCQVYQSEMQRSWARDKYQELLV